MAAANKVFDTICRPADDIGRASWLPWDKEVDHEADSDRIRYS